MAGGRKRKKKKKRLDEIEAFPPPHHEYFPHHQEDAGVLSELFVPGLGHNSQSPLGRRRGGRRRESCAGFKRFLRT